jgi:transmembrane sensor
MGNAMGANDNTTAADDAMEQAADWIDRLDALSDSGRRDLNAWLAASPAHAAAFAVMRHTMLDTALIEAADRVLAKPAPARPAAAPARRLWRFGAAPGDLRRAGLIAAGLAAVAVLVPIAASRWTAAHRPPAAAQPSLELATAVGARSDYGLSDTSVVHLNADSRLSVVFTPASRDVRLHKGDAMFDVARNPQRPFNVRAGDATVTAVGTSFEVDMVSDAVEVRVFDGAVRVTPDATASARLVHKGEWLRLVADHGSASGRFAPETYQTWRTDWLDADNTPLKYVVARLNRYTGDKIVLKGDAISDIGVTGRFQLSRTADALSMISALLDVDAVRAGERVYLSPRRAAAKHEG